MTLAVFELNDSAIGHGTGVDNWQHSPGYALLDGDGIATGEQARARAWLEPQRSFYQYWHQLNLSPLSTHNGAARHHADLAYAQLQQLHQDSGEPDEVVLAVPGSFTRDQLALLLGLAKASPFQAVGLVDSAIAAASQSGRQGPALYVDIQLHQAVLTRLEGSGELVRTEVEPLNDLGIKGLMDTWAHSIAEQFIRQYRYDPLHTAGGEQQLYDQLPLWLRDLNSAPQTTASLDTAKGNFRLNLLRDELLASSQQRLQRLLRGIEKFRRSGDQLLISQRLAQLPGLVEALHGDCLIAGDQAVIEGCLANLDAIRGDAESLKFVTRLPVSGAVARPTAPPSAAAEHTDQADNQPTHALYGHRAVAIQDLLNFQHGDRGLRHSRSGEADLSLSINGAGLKLSCHPEASVEAPAELVAGAVIRLNGEPIQLIQVES